jgi:hypothetical protein
MTKTCTIRSGIWPMQYETKIKTTKRIHLLNFLGENNPKGVQKPSWKDHLFTNATYVRKLA